MATDNSSKGGDGTGHASYLAYRNFFYAKAAAALAVVASLLYAWHNPLHGASGSTWLGYGLGIVSLGLMGWLAWFGVRKRQFQTGRGAVRGWVSAHVYLGLALLVTATLHSGFHFSFNLHTIAYLLLCGVVLSGLYGMLVYSVVPPQVTQNRRGLPPRAMLAEIHRLDDTALRLSDKVGPEVHAIVSRSVANVRIGGSAWQQLTGRYAGHNDRGLRALAEKRSDQLRRQSGKGKSVLHTQAVDRLETVVVMADQLFESKQHNQADEIKRILDMLTQRKALVERLNRDVTLRARLNVWLYVHVPLTVGLVVAVLAHVVAVFYYL